VSSIDSAGFVDSSVRLSLPVMPSRITVSVSSIPFAQRAGSAGVRVVELGGEPLQLLERPVIVGVRPRATHAAEDRRAVALGQVAHHVAFLVHVMPTSA